MRYLVRISRLSETHAWPRTTHPLTACAPLLPRPYAADGILGTATPDPNRTPQPQSPHP